MLFSQHFHLMMTNHTMSGIMISLIVWLAILMPLFGHSQTGVYCTTLVGAHTTQVGSYTTQVGSYTSQVGNYATHAGSYTSQMGNYATHAGSNATQMGAYTTQVGSNTTQVGSNTTQVGNYTTQVGSSAAQAGSFAAQVGAFATSAGTTICLVSQDRDSEVYCHHPTHAPWDSNSDGHSYSIATQVGAFAIPVLIYHVPPSSHAIYSYSQPNETLTMQNENAEGPLSYYSRLLNHDSFLLEFYANVIVNLLLCQNLFYYVHSPTNLCLYIKLKLQQNLFRKHDFLAIIKSIPKPFILSNGSIFLSNFILYHLLAFDLAVNYIHHETLSLLHNTGSMSTNTDNQNNDFVGGGKAKLFSYSELMENGDIDPNLISAKFKFHSYILEDGILPLPSESLFMVKYPLHLLTPRLTISELKLIAACHGISFHSKISLVQIQLSINNHKCQVCQSFVTVFELINPEERRRSSVLNAAKKYQMKHPDIYKTKLVGSGPLQAWQI